MTIFKKANAVKNIKERKIVNIMDSLYTTYLKFKTNSKIVKITFEIITLLGYVYPEWKTKVGKNFIPCVVEALNYEDFG